jgi:hypothetical protein
MWIDLPVRVCERDLSERDLNGITKALQQQNIVLALLGSSIPS